MYPMVKFFKNQTVMDEIMPCILELFTGRIEEEIKIQQEIEQKALNFLPQPDTMTLEINEQSNPISGIFSKQSSPGLGMLGKNVGSSLSF